MRKHVFLTLRIFVFLLLLPLLGVAFAPPARIRAQCSTTGSQIQVSEGLISAIDVAGFQPIDNVDCIEGQRASIPQFSIKDYEAMKKDYFDQAKSTYNKKTLQGDQTQNSVSDPINLISF